MSTDTDPTRNDAFGGRKIVELAGRMEKFSMDVRHGVAGGAAVLVLAMTGTYLWLDGTKDAAAPAGAESTETFPGDGASRNAAGDETSPAEAGSGDAASDLPGAAAAPDPNQPRTRVSGEVAIQWAQSLAGGSKAMEEARRLRAASGLIDRSVIPGDPNYDGSIAFATQIEMQERFDTEVRDQQWARTAERQAEQFVDSHPFREVYGPLALECKATLCRIAAVGDAQALSAGGFAAQWQNIMFELMRDPRFASLFAEERMQAMTMNEHPGLVGFVSWLRRYQPPDD